jgi:putative YhdH/YhfP family quinone oxidoreductase
MLVSPYKALVVRQEEDRYVRSVENRTLADLPENEVLIQVHYSSLNYKDALSASGNRGVTRRYPHTPGIDAAGVVVESSVSHVPAGSEVICTGYDLGMNTPGGFGRYIRVPSGWVLPRPEGLSLHETMQLGTAGFTAAQCVERLMHFGVRPDQGPVLVTGATGGVGATAVALLSKAGFTVTGVTGKEHEHSFLKALGCSAILNRKQALGRVSAAMLRERWAGVVDTVGGDILASAIKATQYEGVVACCGNAASGDLCMTVYPFILRGVSLVGIDSANCPLGRRAAIWERLSTDWKIELPENFCTTITLDQLDNAIEDMLAGRVRGRLVIDCRGER